MFDHLHLSGVILPPAMQEQLNAGDSYGALQTARAVFARLEGQGKGCEGRELILTIARSFAEKGYVRKQPVPRTHIEHYTEYATVSDWLRELQSVVDLAKLYMTNNTEKSGVSDAGKPDVALSDHGYSRGGAHIMPRPL
jgi:hypothetical protein